MSFLTYPVGVYDSMFAILDAYWRTLSMKRSLPIDVKIARLRSKVGHVVNNHVVKRVFESELTN